MITVEFYVSSVTLNDRLNEAKTESARAQVLDKHNRLADSYYAWLQSTMSRKGVSK